MRNFILHSPYTPSGDQPQAISTLSNSILSNHKYQTLLGITGSGKTFTMANLIQNTQKTTLVICHNKTLAAQLYSEFKAFFPQNAVEYFVSYYDYYQPEAYIPQTDTYIEKDSSINDEIDRLRISTSSSLLSRNDVIVVASVSCIYGLGSPEDFTSLIIPISTGQSYPRDSFLEDLVYRQYSRNDNDFKRGSFRVRGEVVDVFPADRQTFLRFEFWGDTIDRISEFDPSSPKPIQSHHSCTLFPTNQYITSPEKLKHAISLIRQELEQHVSLLESQNKLIEAQRIRMRTEYDIQLLQEVGFCSGIENYSRHISARQPGSRPFCLLDFMPKDFLLIIDESHVTLPQIIGMYHGDQSRKARLVEHGFRLPSALDNRPLKPDEFFNIINQTLFVSATPAPKELQLSSTIAHQIIRPTGLLDPIIDIYPTTNQVDHLIGQIHSTIQQGHRVLVTTLTKKMSEDLTSFLEAQNIRVAYIHSDIDAIQRVEILRRLRSGHFDVLIGVNLLREGLDLPEVALVAILDADKEGFLRSQTSLLQTIGRAARHEKGRAILYANTITQSIQATLDITNDRRSKQIEYNTLHNITPKRAQRNEQSSLSLDLPSDQSDPINSQFAHGDLPLAQVLAQLESEMLEASSKLQFEKAAVLRDQINKLKSSP